MKWDHCDICGKPGKLYPLQKAVTEKNNDGIEIQKFETEKYFNPVTGNVEEHQIAVMQDIEPRSIQVHVEVSGKIIRRDFCEEHYISLVQPALRNLWNLLENITPID